MENSAVRAVTDLGPLKSAIHRKLIQKLNLDRIAQVDRQVVRNELSDIIETLIAQESTPLALEEKERLSREVLDEVFGLGPLEALLKDPTISDILVNSYKNVFIERKGLLERVP